MVLPVVNTVVVGTGIVLAAAVAVYHAYHVLRAESGVLHGPLEGYYRVLLPYVAISSLVAIAFFTEAVLAREQLAGILSEAYLTDVAFLGLTLVWLGAASRLFTALDDMADTYFAEGDHDGG